MDDGSDQRGEERAALEAVFLPIDSKLNIFALANGLDLLRDEEPTPSRTLEWFREGMERRIRMVARRPGTVTISVEASRKVEGTRHRATAAFRESVDGDILHQSFTGILEEGIERANALEESQLEPSDGAV